MKPDLPARLCLSAVLAVLSSAPAAAQTDPETAFNAALSAISRKVAEGSLTKDLGRRPQASAALAMGEAAAAAESCPDARELEISFILTIDGGRELLFSYAGCREEGRNDYLPPYTERSYKGQGGYGLTIVTDQGAESSEVLVSKGMDWVGNFGKLANAKLVSGEAIAAGEILMMDKAKTPARLRGVPDYPELKACEAALGRADGYGRTEFRDGRGKPIMGYEPARYGEGPVVVMSLVLLTDAAAYYYSEPCDICADVDVCELKTHAAKSLLHAHSIGCRDMAPYAKGKVVFDACAPR